MNNFCFYPFLIQYLCHNRQSCVRAPFIVWTSCYSFIIVLIAESSSIFPHTTRITMSRKLKHWIALPLAYLSGFMFSLIRLHTRYLHAGSFPPEIILSCKIQQFTIYPNIHSTCFFTVSLASVEKSQSKMSLSLSKSKDFAIWPVK